MFAMMLKTWHHILGINMTRLSIYMYQNRIFSQVRLTTMQHSSNLFRHVMFMRWESQCYRTCMKHEMTRINHGPNNTVNFGTAPNITLSFCNFLPTDEMFYVSKTNPNDYGARLIQIHSIIMILCNEHVEIWIKKNIKQNMNKQIFLIRTHWLTFGSLSQAGYWVKRVLSSIR